MKDGQKATKTAAVRSINLSNKDSSKDEPHSSQEQAHEPTKAVGEEEDLIVSSTLAYNRRVLGLGRHYSAIIAGLCAGVLGLQGLWGLLVFVVVTLLGSLAMLVLHLRRDVTTLTGSIQRYFPSVREVVYSQFFSGILSFILCWTLSYDVVYIF
eukprot:GHVS01048158.1.p1 GENE.GHVS01048158.1~~GHVS01048158.1.p1  ORF type:complete len:154 (-),score=26.42 GHVS01048158.1:5-466(-)